MKRFDLIYTDFLDNEICHKVIEAKNTKDAERIASIALSNSRLNDLSQIKVVKL